MDFLTVVQGMQLHGPISPLKPGLHERLLKASGLRGAWVHAIFYRVRTPDQLDWFNL